MIILGSAILQFKFCYILILILLPLIVRMRAVAETWIGRQSIEWSTVRDKTLYDDCTTTASGHGRKAAERKQWHSDGPLVA